MKKLLAVILSISILLTSSLVCSAATVSTEFEGADLETPLEENLQANAAIGETLQLGAKSAILMEFNTGTILYEQSADLKLPPASITKIMTLILVMEAIEGGKMSLEDKVTASEHAASLGGSQIWLEEGEVMTVDELLRATVIASANDATVALAEAVSGSEEGFVAEMNKKAQALGMNNTHFVNSYGLDAEGHLTTAHDVAIMSAELMKYPLMRQYTEKTTDTLRGGESELVNTNKLIRYYDGCFGLKTGTTSGAGSCLSAIAEREGLTLIAVVLGSPTSKERFSATAKLLDFGFANYSFAEIEADTEGFSDILVRRGTAKQITPAAGEKFFALLEKGSEKDITQEIELPTELTAPVREGETVGYVHIMLGEEELGVIPITASTGSEALSFWYCLRRLLQSLFTL